MQVHTAEVGTGQASGSSVTKLLFPLAVPPLLQKGDPQLGQQVSMGSPPGWKEDWPGRAFVTLSNRLPQPAVTRWGECGACVQGPWVSVGLLFLLAV